MTRARRFGVGLLGLGASLLLASPASAAGRVLDAVSLAKTKVTVDGLLREWPGELIELGERLRGSPGGARASVSIGYDERNVYVALELVDAKLVRTPGAGAAEDHATVTLATAKGAAQSIDIFPGDPGKLAGVVKVRGGGAVPGAKVVEAPAKGGLEVEALIPWSAFGEAGRTRVGLRGAVEYTDADAPGQIRAVLSTSAQPGASALPPFRLEAEQGLEANLLRPNGLSTTPSRVAYGDVAGDAMVEQVAVYGTYLTIVGAHYRGGSQFYFGELGVASANLIDSLKLVDVDGDGKDELVIEKRVGGAERYRGVIEISKVGRDDAPYRLFAHETAVVTPEGRVVNRVRLVKRGRGFAVEIAQDRAEGFEPGSYREPVSDDMGGALLPWQSVVSRTFAWDGKAFGQVEEKTGTPKLSKPRAAPASPSGPPPPPAPRPPTPDELMDRVYALYRQERHVGAAKPRFDFVTDVVGDTRPERVLVHERDIVVFGKGFRGGTSYAFITIGVTDAKDVLDVTARDLTGDGKAEILVRGVLHAKASKELGGGVVERYAFFAYQVTGAGVARIFAAETGRAMGEDRILGTITFVPGARGLDIELGPGRAVGWTERTYPFPPDTTTAGGLEPLALPWSGSAPRRYAFDGKSYAAR
ncbi:MAG: hypothetical protein OZ921_05920 [Sorangiineae bacterium]|nr:hypothetical protein [Polyangiaceae bacterium]MEB2322031.1 hypothetical protein [Sorangiineae bacterium]